MGMGSSIRKARRFGLAGVCRGWVGIVLVICGIRVNINIVSIISSMISLDVIGVRWVFIVIFIVIGV